MPYYLLKEDEFAANEEVTYGTSPADPVATDFFKHTSTHVGVQHVLEEQARDRDRDVAQASVLTLLTGREKAQVSIEADIIPAGVATPTAPDIKTLLKAVMGVRNTRTAHTTTAAGSTTTSINLTTGGGAASGIATGDLVGVDVSAAFGVEVRQVASIAGDVMVVDRALSAAPASGRDVIVGSTFLLSNSALISLHLWLFNSVNKYKIPGTILNEADFAFNYADGVPVGKVRFSGEGQTEATHTASRPTPTTQGIPLVPSVGKIWFGSTKLPIISSGLNIKNGLELRNNESDGLKPSAVKRTGNNSRYMIEQTIETYWTDTMKTHYDNSRTRALIDAIVQHGDAKGKIFAYRTPAWRPRGERTEQDGEIGLRLAGRCFGVSNDDETRAAFL